MKLFGALVLVVCSGCTHIWWPDVTVKKLHAADDGRERYELLCPPGSMCFREEKRLCPIGFDREEEGEKADTEIITCWTEVPEDPCVKAKVCGQQRWAPPE